MSTSPQGLHAVGGALLGIVVLSALPKMATFISQSWRRRRQLGSQPSNEDEPVDLTLPFGPTPSAAETFHSLAEASEAHSVDFQDYYGATKPGGRPWLGEFEARVAADLGKEAGLFLPSGTMAQLILLCCAQKTKIGEENIHALPAVRRPFFAHPSSHLLLWEQGAHANLLNVPCLSVGRPDKPLSSEDISSEMRAGVTSTAPPCAVILEVPHRELGGAMTSWNEIKKIRAVCNAKGMHFHMDGARLWEALPFFADPSNGGVNCHQFCAQFDSIYVSFYKGLGGMTGAMLVGSQVLIDEARVWLRRFGGNLFTLMPYALSDMVAYEKRRHSFEHRRAIAKSFALAVVAAAASAGASDRVIVGPRNLSGDGTTLPTCSFMHVRLKGSVEELEQARDQATKISGFKVFRALRPAPGPDEKEWLYLEWVIGETNGAIAPSVVERAWASFFSVLTAKVKKQEHTT